MAPRGDAMGRETEMTRRARRWLRAALLTALGLGLAAGTARAQWQIESKDGKSSVKFGFLVQPQLETLETAD